MSDLNPPSMIEVWKKGADRPFLRIQSQLAPARGELISIAGKTYKVLHRSFAVDYSEKTFERQMRCNLEVKEECTST